MKLLTVSSCLIIFTFRLRTCSVCHCWSQAFIIIERWYLTKQYIQKILDQFHKIHFRWWFNCWERCSLQDVIISMFQTLKLNKHFQRQDRCCWSGITQFKMSRSQRREILKSSELSESKKSDVVASECFQATEQSFDHISSRVLESGGIKTDPGSYLWWSVVKSLI